MHGDRRMAGAVKADDGFFATFVVSSYSPYIVRWAARRRITPNQVTLASAVLAMAAAVSFATGTRPGLIGGAVLVQVAFTADCVDGQLARYTAMSSPLGAWLDAVSDRFKEFVLYAGLAVGGARGGDPDVWLLAACALALQALRHQVDFAYAAQAGPASIGESHTAAGAARPANDAAQRVGVAGVRTADAFERSRLKWIKRIVVLPIGERFALISLTAAIAGPRTVFVVLLAWGALAATYMTGGRVLRSLADARARAGRPRGARPSYGAVGLMNRVLASYRDDGPLALALQRIAPGWVPAASATLLACLALGLGLLIDGARTGAASIVGVVVFVVLGAVSGAGRVDGRVRWTVPPLLHAGEYATLIVLAWRVGAPPAAFVLLAVVACHHYDVIYQRTTAQRRPVDLLTGGWDGRTLLVSVAALAAILTGVIIALAVWTAVLLGAAGVQQARALARDPWEPLS